MIEILLSYVFLTNMKFIDFITYTGIFIFALSGAFKARGAKLDIFGALVVAFISAYGGGTIRDLLLGVRPVNWINDNLALTLVFAGTVITFFAKDKLNKFQKTIFFTDAIGLGLFTAMGIGIADKMEVNNIYSLVMGVITATFGGLLADIFCGYPPVLLRKGELYATTSAFGGILFIIFKEVFLLHKDVNLAVCIVAVVALRIISKWKNIMLPNI